MNMDENTQAQFKKLLTRFPVEFNAFYDQWAKDYDYRTWLKAIVRDKELSEDDSSLVIAWLDKVIESCDNTYYQVIHDMFMGDSSLLPALENETLRTWITDQGGATEIISWIKDDSSTCDVFWRQTLAQGVATVAFTRFAHRLEY